MRRHQWLSLSTRVPKSLRLYDRIVISLGGTPKYQSAALAAQASAALAAEVDERGRTPAVVIDESHLLDHHELDVIRMLTNYELDSTTAFGCC